jgi:hypothetical protein
MTTPPTGAPDAIVYSNPPFGFSVAPPVVSKHAGDVFTILNATTVSVHVVFPVLGTNPPEADIAPHTRADFIIDPGTAHGTYDYYVEITAVTRELIGFTLRANAASDPHIIID